MKKIIIILAAVVMISLLVPFVEAKACCQVAGNKFCITGNDCTADGYGPVIPCESGAPPYGSCDKCGCCGLNTGCPTCGDTGCSENIKCSNYVCGLCSVVGVSCSGFGADGTKCANCGCTFNSVLSRCEGTPDSSVITSSSVCSSCGGSWGSNACNSVYKTCCSNNQQGTCTDGTLDIITGFSINPICTSLSSCSDLCFSSNKTRYYNGACTGGLGSTCSYGSQQSVDCCNDNDCTGYDPNTYTKNVCRCPSGCSLTGSTYTCEPKPYCAFNSECDTNWCCTYDSDIPLDDRESPGSCSYSSLNPIYKNKYLCDPPGWTTAEKQNSNLIDSVVNFFSNLFSSIK